MHAVVPIVSLVGQLATELNESGNRKRRGEKFVGMLAKAKHQPKKKRAITTAGHIETGRLEKADPLPLGRYWIDVFADKKGVWEFWFALQGPNVVIENQEEFEAIEEEGASGGYQARTWILFRVVAPNVHWGVAMALGWPTVAGRDVKTSDDTVQKPDPNDILTEWLPDWEKLSPGWKVGIVSGVLVVIALVVGYVARGVR